MKERGGGGRSEEGSTVPHIFRLFNFASDSRAQRSRRVLRGLRGSSAMTSASTRHNVVTLFPPQPPRLLPGSLLLLLLPALFGAPALQRSLGRPCFSPTFTQGCETREAGGRLEWEEGKTDAKQPEKAEEERAPRRSLNGETGSWSSEQNFPPPSFSPTIFEEFSPRQSAETSFSFPLEASGILTPYFWKLSC